MSCCRSSFRRKMGPGPCGRMTATTFVDENGRNTFGMTGTPFQSFYEIKQYRVHCISNVRTEAQYCTVLFLFRGVLRYCLRKTPSDLLGGRLDVKGIPREKRTEGSEERDHSAISSVSGGRVRGREWGKWEMGVVVVG